MIDPANAPKVTEPLPTSQTPPTPELPSQAPIQASQQAQMNVEREGVSHRQVPDQVQPGKATELPADQHKDLRMDIVAKSLEFSSARTEARSDLNRPNQFLTDAVLSRAGLTRREDGSLELLDKVEIRTLQAWTLSKTQSALLSPELMTTLGPPPVIESAINGEQIASFVDAMGRAVDDVLTDPAGIPRLVDVISSDALTAAFLKVNILDPLESQEMQDQLDEALTNLAQQKLDEIAKKMENAYRELKEAMASAMGGFFMAAIIAAIIAVVVAAIIAGIIAAIITAVIMMVVVQMVMSQVKAMVAKEAAAARAEIERQGKEGREKVAEEVARIREEEMQKIKDATPVGEDGLPLTELQIKGRLQPKLADAVVKVLAMADADGAAQAGEQGPQIIHDAMMEELLKMGLSEENADGMAWAITAETMATIEQKLGLNKQTDDGQVAKPLMVPEVTVPDQGTGRDPADTLGDPAAENPANQNQQSQTLGPSGTAITEPESVEAIPEQSPGRNPDEMLGDAAGGFLGANSATLNADSAAKLSALEEQLESLEALLASPIMDQARDYVAKNGGEELIQSIKDDIETKGIAQTLVDRSMEDQNVSPAATLGLTAVIEGAIEDQDALRVQDMQDVIRQVAESKDRALEALAQVGQQAEMATLNLQNPSLV